MEEKESIKICLYTTKKGVRKGRFEFDEAVKPCLLFLFLGKGKEGVTEFIEGLTSRKDDINNFSVRQMVKIGGELCAYGQAMMERAVDKALESSKKKVR